MTHPNNDGIIHTPAAPDPEPEPVKGDHPAWGLLICLVVCATIALTVQMITGYHW